MLKPKAMDAKESNIANLGSQMEKDARKAAAATEEEFKGAGAAVGVEVWRVEKLAVKRVPKESYGSFYSGDSYIVLQTYKQGNKLMYNVHFWLGQHTSQDEAGVAAYKTVELDDLLGTTPVQFREIEEHESEEFLACFNGRIRTMQGGIDSGFNFVKPDEYKPRLLHVKGKPNGLRVHEVPLERASLNNGDVFILDAGLRVWQWNGTKANVHEKNKANTIVNDLESERRGKVKSTILDGPEDDADFWKLLGGKGDVKECNGVSDDDVKDFVKKLYRLSDANGALKLTEVESGKLKKASLESNDAFIVDAGHTVYVWVGSKASAGEKKKAIPHAVEYLSKQGRPAYTPVTRIVDGGETDAFNRCFA